MSCQEPTNKISLDERWSIPLSGVQTLYIVELKLSLRARLARQTHARHMPSPQRSLLPVWPFGSTDNLAILTVDVTMTNVSWASMLSPGPEYASKTSALSILDWTKDPASICSSEPRKFD